MGWLSILLLVIQYGPAIVHLVVEIVDMIKRLRHPTEQSHFKAELEDAVKRYKETGDRTWLRALRDRLITRLFVTVPKPAA